MIDNDRKCLAALAECYDPAGCGFVGFDYLAEATGLNRKVVRVCVRRLARKDLASFYRGLFDENDKPAGSGYACTKEGKARAEQLGVANPQ